MKKIISILLASTMLFSFTAPTFAADSSFSESCGHIENPTRFNPTELSEYQQCWVDFYKADEVSGMIGGIFWMRLGDDTISITRDEIRAGGKGVIRSAIEQWVVDNQLEVVAARITAAEGMVEELSADLEEALADAEMKAAEIERIQGELTAMIQLRDNLQGVVDGEGARQAAAVSAAVAPLNARITGLTTDLANEQAALATANASIAMLTADLTAMTADRDSQVMMLAAANATIATHVATIANKDAQIVTLTAARDALQATVDGEPARVAAAVAAAVAPLNTQIAMLTADLATANGSITTLTADLAAMTAARDALQATVDGEAARTASAVAAAVAPLNSQISTLMAERDAARASLAAIDNTNYADEQAAYNAGFTAGSSGVDASHDVTIGTAAALAVTGDVTLQVRAQNGDIQYSSDNGVTWIDSGTYTQRDNDHAIQIGSRTFNFLGDGVLPVRAQGGNIEVQFSSVWNVVGSYVERDNSHVVTIADQTVTVTDDATITATLSALNNHDDGTFSQTLQINGVDTTTNTVRFISNSAMDWAPGVRNSIVYDAEDGRYVFRSGYGNITAVEAARDMFETQRDAARTALGDLESSVLGITGTGVSSDNVATRIGEIQGALGRLDFILNAVPTGRNAAPDIDMDGNPDGDDYDPTSTASWSGHANYSDLRGAFTLSAQNQGFYVHNGQIMADRGSSIVLTGTYAGSYTRAQILANGSSHLLDAATAQGYDFGSSAVRDAFVAVIDDITDTAWEEGYDAGYADGYDDGFDDGYAAGYSDGVTWGRANP